MSIELSACELDELRNRIRIKAAVDRQSHVNNSDLGFKPPPLILPNPVYRFRRPKINRETVQKLTGRVDVHTGPKTDIQSSRYYARKKYTKRCPACGRALRLIDGKIMAHRVRQDEFGHAEGPFCDYHEIEL